MAFQLEKISDADKEKFGFTSKRMFTSKWLVDHDRGARLLYVDVVANRVFIIFDLLWKDSKIRAITERKIPVVEPSPYDGEFKIVKILYEEGYQQYLEEYKALLEEGLKLHGRFGNPDDSGDIKIIWPDTMKVVSVANINETRGV